jgi:CRP-like cAMP-binding protein
MPASGAEAGAATLERAVALRGIAGLETLEPELLTTLAAHTQLCRHAAGERLAGVGNERPAIHLVLAGSVRERAGHGRERRVERGGLVGDLGASFGEIGPEEATALEDSETLALPLEDLIDLCEEHFSLLLGVLRAAARAALAAGRREAAAEPPAAPEPSAAAGEARALPLGERVSRLAAIPLFEEMAVHTLGRIALDAQAIGLAPGEALWRAGDAPGRVAVVLSGSLACEAPDGGFEVGPGALVGLLESLAGAPRGFTARAGRPLAALVLDAGVLLDAMEDDPEMAIDVLAALARSLAPPRRADP